MLRRLTLVAALVGAMAIFLAYEHSRVTRAGYKISELSSDEAKLVEEIRIHQVQVTKLRQPQFIKHQVETLKIDLMHAPEAELVPVTASPSDAAE
jgi:hypothetical protein